MQNTLRSIEKQMDDIEDLKFQVQAAMFNELDEITEDEVGEYSESITIRLSTYNEYVERLQEKLEILKKEEASQAIRSIKVRILELNYPSLSSRSFKETIWTG